MYGDCLRKEDFDYKTPGLDKYCQDMKNYMNYMAPVITDGRVKYEQNQYK